MDKHCCDNCDSHSIVFYKNWKRKHLATTYNFLYEMRFIQTLYFPRSADLLYDGLGWYRPEFHLMGWALSCLQLLKYYNNVELYTTDEGARWLIDLLGLPYTKVHTDLANFSLPHPKLWALPKVYTYSLQEKPFLHVDGDVFLFERLPHRLLEGELICQNIEKGTDYYISAQKQIMQNFCYFPSMVKNDFCHKQTLYAVNAGLLGGNDLNFFRRYTKEAFTYVDTNFNFLKYIDIQKFNIFFEQHLFYSMSCHEGKYITCLDENIYDDNGYRNIGSIDEAPYVEKYIHLLGNFKKREISCFNMAEKLRVLYPDYYYKILSLFIDNGVPVFSDIYTFDNVENYHILENTSQTVFKIGKLQGGSLLRLPSFSSNFVKEIKMELKKLMGDKWTDNQWLFADFLKFKEHVLAMEDELSIYSGDYFYGRDFFSNTWVEPFLTKDTDSLLKNVFVRTKGIRIIPSEYDWAGFFQKKYKKGVDYYDNLDVLKKGRFYNLLIPNINKGVWAYDIDEFDGILLEKCKKRISLKEILNECSSYFDADVINNQYYKYQHYIINEIANLVKMKAIMCINKE